jgi:hypothetical protein
VPPLLTILPREREREREGEREEIETIALQSEIEEKEEERVGLTERGSHPLHPLPSVPKQWTGPPNPSRGIGIEGLIQPLKK